MPAYCSERRRDQEDSSARQRGFHESARSPDQERKTDDDGPGPKKDRLSRALSGLTDRDSQAREREEQRQRYQQASRDSADQARAPLDAPLERRVLLSSCW